MRCLTLSEFADLYQIRFMRAFRCLTLPFGHTRCTIRGFMASSEKRRAARKKHDSVLELYDESGTFMSGIGRLVDLSTVGVCFSTSLPLAKGDHIRARLRILKEGLLDITGHVGWVRKKNNSLLYGV